MQQRARQKARPDFPHAHDALFERDRHESAAVGRECACRRAMGVSIEHVELGRGFQVVHDEGTFGGADGETLGRGVKVDGGEAVEGVSGGEVQINRGEHTF